MYLQINFFPFGLQGENHRYKVFFFWLQRYKFLKWINNRNVILLLILKDTNRSYIININISTKRNKRFIKKKGKKVLITESI